MCHLLLLCFLRSLTPETVFPCLFLQKKIFHFSELFFLHFSGLLRTIMVVFQSAPIALALFSCLVSEGSCIYKQVFSILCVLRQSIYHIRGIYSKNHVDWQAADEMWFLGQGLSDHLSKKTYNVAAAEKADARLAGLLWQSIDSKLMVYFCPYETCCDIWEIA